MCSCVTGQRRKMEERVCAGRETSQTYSTCTTKRPCAGSMHTILKAVQDWNVATPTDWKISPPDRSFPMQNQRNKHWLNTLVQVRGKRANHRHFGAAGNFFYQPVFCFSKFHFLLFHLACTHFDV